MYFARTSYCDHWWGWKTVTEIMAEIATANHMSSFQTESGRWYSEAAESLREFDRLVSQAWDGFYKLGYDGEPRGAMEMMAIALPVPDNGDGGLPEWIFWIKQDENGTCYFGSTTTLWFPSQRVEEYA